MLDKEQRRAIMDLFGSGVSISDISKKVGVSRASVYRIIESDFEKDAEIHNLKKELRKTELRKKIMELREPLKTRSKLAELKKVIDGLIPIVLFIWDTVPEMGEKPHKCLYCGGELKASPIKIRNKLYHAGYKCKGCKREFPLP